MPGRRRTRAPAGGGPADRPGSRPGSAGRVCTCTNGGLTTVAATSRPRTSIDDLVALGDAGCEQRQGDALLAGSGEKVPEVTSPTASPSRP